MDPLVVEFPDWLVEGFGPGVVLAGLVAATFVLGTRRFPDSTSPPAIGPDGVEARRRTEIREYLRSIDEPFAEDSHLEGRTVAFFLPERGLALTFDVKACFELERHGVRAILVEGEPPGASLGGRLPFETPSSVPDDQPVARAFARLGLSPSADAAAVRAAYRDRIEAAHPRPRR